MTTKPADRCPHSDLTQAQAFWLAGIAMQWDRQTHWLGRNGIARSLVMRGLLASTRDKLTAEGVAALRRCTWFSMKMRQSFRGGPINGCGD